jgi:NAD-dependent DNA ligase
VTNFFARQGAAYINEMNRSLGALLGIATGILSDRQLVDAEILFLNDWLEANSAIATSWPGDVIHARVRAVLSDGVVTAVEREHLMQTLQQLIGGTVEEIAALPQITKLAFDDVPEIRFSGANFCLTGDFVFAPREVCTREIESRGGIVKNSVSKKLNYVVIGGLGSSEWKHGSFGTKIERAMQLKQEGAALFIVHEDHWVRAL